MNNNISFANTAYSSTTREEFINNQGNNSIIPQPRECETKSDKEGDSLW